METLSLDVFEILRHCDSSKFLYLTHKYSIKSRKYNPYSLVLTSYDDININNYFTIDSEDFIHHYDCGSEIIDEFQWERENDLYNKLIKIDFFAKFKLMKYFSHWIKLIRAKKMKKASEVITSRVHIFDKNLRKSLTDICEMCSIIEEKNFLLSVNFFQASFEVFYVLQLEHLKQLTSNLNDFRELLLEIVYDGCNKSLKVTGFNVNHLHDMGHTKEALKKWHCEKLTRYIRLVDYIFFTTLYKLFHNSLVALLKFLTENVQNINPSHGNIEEKIKYQECQVGNTLQLHQQNLIVPKISATEADLQIRIKNLIIMWQKILLETKNLSGDGSLGIFTRPLINGRIIENVSRNSWQLSSELINCNKCREIIVYINESSHPKL